MDLRGRFGALKAARIKWLRLLMSASCGVERMARRHSQSRLQIVRLYSRRLHHLGKRRVGAELVAAALCSDRECKSMLCVMPRLGKQNQKVISERQRSAGARRATSSEQSCGLQTLREHLAAD